MEFQIQSRILLWTLPAVFFLGSCKKPAKEPSPAEKIKKVWIADRVSENNTIVYTKGATGNTRNYATFRLDLSNPPTVTLTDYDGVMCTGQYDVLGDTRLVLKNLTPQPTGTNGTIEYTIKTISDSQIDLTRITANVKTGSTNNQYVLTNL